MRSIGRRETVVIGVVTMIAVIAAGWFMLIKPASSKVSGLKVQADQQQQSNDALRTQIAVLKAEKKKLPQEQAELAKLTQRVPDSAELPNLLRQMQKVAKDSGVELKGITPTPPAPLTGASGIDAVGVTLVASGGYAEVEQFDSALESLSRAFLVSGFSLSDNSASAAGPAGGASSNAGGAVNATFTGRVLLRAPAPTTTAAG